MCRNPILLANGVRAACRHCWQCKRRRCDDWLGRCIAEGKTALGVTVVTLTYGRDHLYDSADHLQAAVLTYEDVQKYLRSYRDAGYRLRYFVVGEYGSRKQRAHWHVIVFWQNKVPVREHEVDFIDTGHWDHGWSYWKPCLPDNMAAAITYATKYISKELTEDDVQAHMGLSRMPPLGDAYFKRLAREYCKQRLAPQNNFYSFPEVVDKHGRVKNFYLEGVSLDNFLAAYLENWAAMYGNHDDVPNSELVEEYCDSIIAASSPEEARKIIEMEKHGIVDNWVKLPYVGSVQKPKLEDLRPWMDKKRVVFKESLHHWVYKHEGDQGYWYWARNSEGVWAWRHKPGAQEPAVRELQSKKQLIYKERRAG